MARRAPHAALVPLMLMITAIAGCAAPPEEEHAPRADILHHGVHLSPRAYQGADFTGFFDEAPGLGDTIAWSGDWLHIPREGTTAAIVAERAAVADLRDAFLPSFFNPDTGQPIRELNNTTIDFYVRGAALFASVHQPTYMGLGVDVDRLYVGNRSAYDAFTTWYADAYDGIKAASPDTQVFPVFQYEHMKGARGGISTGTGNSTTATRTTAEPLWHILTDFPKRDLTAFSSYPGLYYRDPADIPADHYDDMRTHAHGALAITETGWHTSAAPPGWESDAAEQGRYIERLYDIAPPLSLVLWKQVHDQSGAPPFDSMGLIDHDRRPRDAWYAWRAEARPDLAARDSNNR